MNNPICSNQLNAYLSTVSGRLAAVPRPYQSNAHAQRAAQLAGAVSAAASAFSSALAGLESEFDALAADIAADEAERARAAAARG